MRRIIAGVDDLLFASKIRAAGQGLAVDLVFGRSAAEMLLLARETRPALVILDLNSARLRALDAVAALKGDPALADVRIVGFVSHVMTDVVNAARRAGVDEVMARSAFAARLPEILADTGPAEAGRHV
jgi:CheY-like chemotaxis protein